MLFILFCHHRPLTFLIKSLLERYRLSMPYAYKRYLLAIIAFYSAYMCYKQIANIMEIFDDFTRSDQ